MANGQYYEKVGDKYSLSVTVTDKMVRDFAEVSGDKNPIHLDEEVAKTTPYGRRIAHGMLAASFISRALVEGMPGRTGVYLTQTLKFSKPVFIGDTLSVELEVLSENEKRKMRFGTLSTIVKNQHGEVVVKGEALVILGQPKS